MMAKGFIILQEAIAICLLCLLCTATVLSVSYSLRLEQKNLALLRCLQHAEAALAGENLLECSGKITIIGTQVKFLEVEVSDETNKLTLFEALTPEEAERLSSAGAAF